MEKKIEESWVYAFDAQELKKDIIMKRCIENDLSLQDVAVKIGVSKATLSRIERKEFSPDIETFSKLVSWLGTEPNKYFTKTPF